MAMEHGTVHPVPVIPAGMAAIVPMAVPGRGVAITVIGTEQRVPVIPAGAGMIVQHVNPHAPGPNGLMWIIRNRVFQGVIEKPLIISEPLEEKYVLVQKK